MPVIEIAANRRALVVDGTRVYLTNNEFAIGERLVRAKGDVVNRDVLLRAMYGALDEPSTSLIVVRVTICALRKKLKPFNATIRSRQRLGYWLEDARS